MKFLQRGKDGGPESHVYGYWLVEIKGLFSVVLLRFEDGTRSAYHSHAFNSISWLLAGGGLLERDKHGLITNYFDPGLRPIITRRSTFHQVKSFGRNWVLSFRGPWAKTWKEYLPEEGREITLADGRKESE
jgi:hypothetical protein